MQLPGAPLTPDLELQATVGQAPHGVGPDLELAEVAVAAGDRQHPRLDVRPARLVGGACAVSAGDLQPPRLDVRPAHLVGGACAAAGVDKDSADDESGGGGEGRD